MFDPENDADQELNDYIDNLVEGSGKLIKPTNLETQIDELKKAYENKRLVLVLGAGAAIDQGLPDWDTLLQKLLFNTLNTQTDRTKEQSLVMAKIFAKLFSPSPLIAGRYLTHQFGDRSKRKKGFKNLLPINKTVRKILYEERINRETELLKEIRRLCSVTLNGILINSIITYNYDDMLECYFSREDCQIPHKSIYTSNIRYRSGEIPIYHVHGFLPYRKEISYGNIILSEDSYHEQYKKSYNWNNFVQIDKFANFNCLFIGVSLTDPNMRRLLDISKNMNRKSRIQHHLIRKRNDINKIRKNLEILLNFDEELFMQKKYARLGFEDTLHKLIKLMENFQEKDAESFNIGTIWVDSHSATPRILSRIGQ